MKSKFFYIFMLLFSLISFTISAQDEECMADPGRTHDFPDNEAAPGINNPSCTSDLTPTGIKRAKNDALKKLFETINYPHMDKLCKGTCPPGEECTLTGATTSGVSDFTLHMDTVYAGGVIHEICIYYSFHAGPDGSSITFIGVCECLPGRGETRSTSNRQGNSYTTGIFRLVDDNFGIAIDRFNENGNKVWSKKYGHDGYNSGRGITTDEQANNIATGEMSNTVAFDSQTFVAFGNKDIFVVKNNKEGIEQWARQAGSNAEDSGLDIVVDDLGNTYIVGYYKATANFDNIILPHEGTGANGFIAKYNSNGILQWAKSIGGLGNDLVNGISLSTDGHLYITGLFETSATFGSYNLSSNNNETLFLAKLNLDGEFVWAEKYETANSNTAGNALVTDLANNIILVGVENNQMLILKYSPNGNLLKEKHAESTGGYFRLLDITTKGNQGNIQVVGQFRGDIYIENELIENLGEQDVFLGEFNANLALVWAKGEGGTAYDYGLGIHNNGSGFTSYVGCTFGTSTISGITQQGSQIIYYRRFNDPAQPTSLAQTLSFDNISIAPNPFSNIFNIEIKTETPQQLKIEILDARARLVHQLANTSLTKGTNTLTINLENQLSKGLYLLRITNEKGQQLTRKIVQQ